MRVGLCILFQEVVVCRLDLNTASLLISPKYAVHLNATCTSFNCHHYSQLGGAWESVCWSRVPEHVKLCRNPFCFQIRSLTIDNPEHENPA